MVVDHTRDCLVRDASPLRDFTNGSPPHRSPQMRSIDQRDLPLTAIANIVARRCERSQYTTTGRLVNIWLQKAFIRSAAAPAAETWCVGSQKGWIGPISIARRYRLPRKRKASRSSKVQRRTACAHHKAGSSAALKHTRQDGYSPTRDRYSAVRLRGVESPPRSESRNSRVPCIWRSSERIRVSSVVA